jgi:hypothetical protein
MLIIFKIVKTKITLSWITFVLLFQKLWNDKSIPYLIEAFLAVPKVELGIWEFGRVMVNGFFGWILHSDDQKNNQMQMLHRSFLGFFWQILPYFQGILLKVAMFRYYIHKSSQYKIRFRKKIYHSHRINFFIWGDFQNVRAFLVGVGLIIMAQSEK